MRIVLFDDILERHVRRSLGRALRSRGHEVVETPAIWRGHLLPTERGDVAMIREALDDVVSPGPDALICFRASTLTPDMLRDLRGRGILTLVWLPDDPVLYGVCYAHVVDHYDYVLNCGGEAVLRFYAERHGIAGINFPFWTDGIEFPRSHDPAAGPDYDIVFLGNIRGQVRRKRYDVIASLPGRVRIYGRVENDPARLCHGYLEEEKAVSAALGRGRIGFSVPQFFADYRGLRYDFPELAGFGSFEVPSRVVQYAAVGLPVLTYGREQPPGHFPEMMVAKDRAELLAQCTKAIEDPESLYSRADATHARFHSAFSAERRAELLDLIFEEPERVLKGSPGDRAHLFAEQCGSSSLLKVVHRSRRRKIKVLVTGFYGHGNLGDELTLQALVEQTAAERPEISFTIVTNKPERVEKDFGLKAVALGDTAGLADTIRSARAAILGGGGLWHDYSFERAGGTAALFNGATASIGGYARPGMMAAAAGVPFHIYGIGVGPLRNPEALALARFIGSQAASVTVRDPGSAAMLTQIDGWSRPVRVAPDMVFACDLGRGAPIPEIAAAAGDLPILGLNLRPWPYGDIEPLLDHLADALSTLQGRRPHLLLGIPLQEGQRQDEATLKALFDRLSPNHPKLVFQWDGQTGRAIEALRMADWLIAMRLHASLIAHCSGVPSLGIAYDPKVDAHFTEVGRGAFCLGIHAPLTSFSDRVLALTSPDAALPAKSLLQIRGLQRRAREEIASLLWRLS